MLTACPQRVPRIDPDGPYLHSRLQVRRLDAEVLQLTKELAEARQRSDEDATQWYQKEKAYVAEASAMRSKLTKVEAELRQSRDETSDQKIVFEAMVTSDDLG